MRYIFAQDAKLRFQWELDVVLTNIYSLKKDADVLILFALGAGRSASVVDHIERRYPQAEVHCYEDTRLNKTYSPTIRPFLWYCYLTEYPEAEEDSYFQCDSDVIFRELPDFSKIPATDKVWYGSDCAGYINYEYLRHTRNGEQIVDNFARIIGVDRSVIETTEGAGAQWVLVQPTADYWLKVMNDCNKLNGYLQGVDSDIQRWTAEMWSQLYNAPYFGVEQRISPELDFCRPTDDVKMWDMVKILHNAGVIGELAKYMFYKGHYCYETPFGRDFSWVRRDKASIKYVEAINAVP